MTDSVGDLKERASLLESESRSLHREAWELRRQARALKQLEKERAAAAYLLECGYTHTNLGGVALSLAEVAERGMERTGA